jgi:hypothetical protein
VAWVIRDWLDENKSVDGKQEEQDDILDAAATDINHTVTTHAHN